MSAQVADVSGDEAAASVVRSIGLGERAVISDDRGVRVSISRSGSGSYSMTIRVPGRQPSRHRARTAEAVIRYLDAVRGVSAVTRYLPALT
jgi:hypothetical protein